MIAGTNEESMTHEKNEEIIEDKKKEEILKEQSFVAGNIHQEKYRKEVKTV